MYHNVPVGNREVIVICRLLMDKLLQAADRMRSPIVD